MSRLLIGIDPDCNQNGVAILDLDTNELDLRNMRFFDLFDYLQNHKPIIKGVNVEAGWLNKSHWHTNTGDSSRLSAQKGNGVGRNHETGRKLAEMLEYLGIKHALIKPKRRKVDNKTFQQIIARQKIKNAPKRTNPEQRDAGILILGEML